ncbi:Helix-turn-helix domain-containing protein [Mesorhizobium albiziae]|uniref:Helix-turn-helix domain-containing protein n=1 Tax=Neomesorhizobium albiziae TaxID=335020 RepID=A0A1I4E7I3_9HYPH|nr:helix-turn-helix domain-containing protein [Mesorhizobium albiziae]SFL01768.1 Helix-turn-helix domain-containing protein [Mesorhizobium albiziae]
MEQRKLYSVREFSAAFGIGRTAFYAELASGRLKAVKLGKKTMVREEDAYEWAAALPAYTNRVSSHQPLTDATIKTLVEADS